VVLAQRSFRLLDLHEPLRALRAEMVALGPVVAPLVAAALAATVAGVAQARVFSLSLLMPKPARLNPLNNLSQLIPGKQSLMEISKQVLKLLAVGYIGYRVIEDALPLFSTLSSEPPLSAAATVVDTASKLVFRVSVAFGIAAALDYWLARRKFL
jgi:flagellar biosynthetic protein FlhB